MYDVKNGLKMGKTYFRTVKQGKDIKNCEILFHKHRQTVFEINISSSTEKGHKLHCTKKGPPGIMH